MNKKQEVVLYSDLLKKDDSSNNIESLFKTFMNIGLSKNLGKIENDLKPHRSKNVSKTYYIYSNSELETAQYKYRKHHIYLFKNTINFSATLKKNKKYLLFIGAKSNSNVRLKINNKIYETNINSEITYFNTILYSSINQKIKIEIIPESYIWLSRIFIEDISENNDLICEKYNESNIFNNSKEYDIIFSITVYFRFDILELIIKNIFKNSKLNIGIILVYSDNENYTFCKNMTSKYKNVFYIWNENQLGSKFYMSILALKVFDYKTAVIIGSDDIPFQEYINLGYEHVKNNVNEVYVTRNMRMYDIQEKKLYHFEYANENYNLPIGAGKILSKKCIEYYNYCLFDPTREAQLDTHFDIKIMNSNIYKFKFTDLKNTIVSPKQGFGEMNGIKKILDSQKSYLKGGCNYGKLPTFNFELLENNEIINNFGLEKLK